MVGTAENAGQARFNSVVGIEFADLVDQRAFRIAIHAGGESCFGIIQHAKPVEPVRAMGKIARRGAGRNEGDIEQGFHGVRGWCGRLRRGADDSRIALFGCCFARNRAMAMALGRGGNCCDCASRGITASIDGIIAALDAAARFAGVALRIPGNPPGFESI